MNVTSKVIETNRVELTITVTAEEFGKGLDIAFEKVRKDVTVQGFRKGKIPRPMFEKNFGVEALYDDALNAVLPDVYTKAIEDENLEPIDYPEWDVKEISKEDGVVATATVWTKPVVELGEYKGLTVTPLSEEVLEEDIQAEIDRLAATRSEMMIKEGAAVDGDTAVIDYEGFKDGVAFEGGKGENHPLELGSNSFIPGFEEQVVGMAAGDEKDIDLTFPEEYHAPDLAGAAVTFKVTVHEVKTRQLPEIDDEFVKDLDQEGIETVEQLRADVTLKLTETKKTAAKNHIESSIVEQAVANAKFEVPEVMVENEISNMVSRMEQQYQQQGISMEMFLQFSGQTMEDMREQMRPQATKLVDQNLVLGAIVAKENMEVSDDELASELEKLAEMYGMEVEQIKTMIPDLSMLKEDVKFKKTIDMMIDSVKLA
ncbi:MAG: trigger factor [Turicibacter sp.]|nr:trigger factor [Turicibacter sp.]